MAYKGDYFTEGGLTGLQPVKNAAGTAPRTGEYAVSSTYATTIGAGCLVSLAETGVILAASTSVPNILGVAASNLAATPGTGATITVFDDPDQQYAVSVDGTVSNTIISIGRFTNTVSNVYNATLGYGKTQLDASEITSLIATGDWLQIMGWIEDTGETVASTYSQALVQITPRFHIYKNTDITTHVT